MHVYIPRRFYVDALLAAYSRGDPGRREPGIGVSAWYSSREYAVLVVFGMGHTEVAYILILSPPTFVGMV